MLSALAYFLAAGAAAGLTAGLFGVGGGLVLVPVLLVMLPGYVPAEHLMQFVIATSLAAIVFGSASSAYGHWRRGAVDMQQWRLLAPTLMAGSLAGAVGAACAERSVLVAYVAVLQAAMCVYMVRRTFAETRVLKSRPPSHSLVAAIAALCVAAGISIGTLIVPYLRRQNVAPHVAVGTASSLGIPVALAGTAVLVVSGYSLSANLPWSIGFVYLPALAGLVPGVVLGAQVGAIVAHRCKPRALMVLFCLFLGTVSLRSVAMLVG